LRPLPPPSFKLLSDEEAKKQDEFMKSAEGQILLKTLSARNFRDTGMVDRETFEAWIEEIKQGRG
jgi:hypothetical protein